MSLNRNPASSYPKGCAAPGFVPCQCNTRGLLSKLKKTPPQRKIHVTSKSPVGDISVVTLIRTDTTLDHSQKAEKVWLPQVVSFIGHDLGRKQSVDCCDGDMVVVWGCTNVGAGRHCAQEGMDPTNKVLVENKLIDLLPQRVCCSWLGARPVQHLRIPEQAQEDVSPMKNRCDKQVSSWRHISCHTDKNRYYT